MTGSAGIKYQEALIMSDMNERCDCLNGVGCGVCACKYHTSENRCTAERINVQNENACRKAETFCSTFTPKSI